MQSATGPGSVELRDVSKSFGDTAVLKNISIEVEQGAFVTLLGPSGCGKTTSLRVLAGFERADSGDVLISGRSVQDLPPWRRDIGIVFQTYALFPYLTAHDNVAFGLKMRRVTRRESQRRVEAALELVGLGGLGGRYPRHLSGGQRQRVALARALVIEPQLLLLDEPLSNLDAKLRGDMRYELKRIQRETGVTTVFVTHDQEEAFSLSDRIVLMNKGTIRQADTPRGLWNRPASAFVADFIGVDNLIPARAVDADTIAFADGARLHTGGHGFDAGAPVIAGLRADAIALHRADAAVTDAFPARIVDMEYRGRDCAYRLRTQRFEQPLVAVAPAGVEFGSEVCVSLPGDKVMVLQDDR